MALLNYTKRLNPCARVIATAESTESARRLWAAGADFVILPHLDASDKVAPLLQQFLMDDCAPNICLEHRQRIMERTGEVIK